MWQEPWGKVELLLVMRVDKPKSLVCHGKATFAYKPFKQFYACLTFFYAHQFADSPIFFIACFQQQLIQKVRQQVNEW